MYDDDVIAQNNLQTEKTITNFMYDDDVIAQNNLQTEKTITNSS